MSAIVPWNDPGGTPCCCVQDCALPSILLPGDYRDIVLTSSEYALLVGGGTLLVEASLTASVVGSERIVTPFIERYAEISVSGSASYQHEHTLNSTTLFGSFRGPRCDQGTTSVLVSENLTSDGDYVFTNNGWEPQDQTIGWSVLSSDTFAIGLYNNGTTNQHGMWFFNRSSRALGQTIWELPDQQGSFRRVAIQVRTETLQFSNDNSSMEFVMPDRTINIPYRRFSNIVFAGAGWNNPTSTSSFNISTHRATYSPLAP